MDKWYLERLRRVLPKHPGEMHRNTVVAAIRKELLDEGREVPDMLEETVQNAYNSYCEGYSAFEKARVQTGREPLFRSDNKGSGFWSLHPDVSPIEPFELDEF